MPKFLSLDTVFLLFIPIMSLGISLIIYFIRGRRERAELDNIWQISDLIRQFSGRSMNNRLALEELIAENPSGTIESGLQELLDESALKYDERWLPPTEHEFSYIMQPSPAELRKQSFVAVIIVAVLGLVATIYCLFNKNLATQPIAALLPLIVSAVGVGILYHQDKYYKERLSAELGKLNKALAMRFPVFNDRAGVALLVDDLQEHEERLNESFKDFNKTARYLADSEFSDGIKAGVKEIMSQEISPPIRDSAKLMQDLSDRLITEQETGMARLAEQFSQAVAAKLTAELSPVSTELSAISEMIGDTRGFIHDSVAVLETSRQQNIELNQELNHSLHLFTVAKSDLANEISEISSNLEVISETTQKMAAIYAGEEARLSQRIMELSDSLQAAFDKLTDALSASGESLELAGQIRTEQEDQNRRLVARLQELNEEITGLSNSLAHSSQNFTHESASYVNQTLEKFDNGLAEVVERLIFTASAIRDAVEALPVALRPNKDI
ncbi:MAG: hypothetical protein Q4P65_02825 [Eubacteriales bacterium]|nr:hypothetical protein [Eubacteriales bacterium]